MSILKWTHTSYKDLYKEKEIQMKIYTSKYRSHWLSPYVILEKVFYWREDIYDREPPKWLQSFCVGLRKFLDTVHPHINYIKIDKYDTWNMDSSMAHIILPMLKQIKEAKCGAPNVNDEDVPDELKSMNAPRCENEWDVDDNFHKRWEWVLDEEIFAFSCLLDDNWADQYQSGVSDWEMKESEETFEGEKLFEAVKGKNHTLKYDWDGMAKGQERINNGLRLFGRYYQGHWT